MSRRPRRNIQMNDFDGTGSGLAFLGLPVHGRLMRT
jgi:hypothetical protein